MEIDLCRQLGSCPRGGGASMRVPHDKDYGACVCVCVFFSWGGSGGGWGKR